MANTSRKTRLLYVSVLTWLISNSAVVMSHASKTVPVQEHGPLTRSAKAQRTKVVEADGTVSPSSAESQSARGLNDAMSVSPSGYTEVVDESEKGLTGQSLEDLRMSLSQSTPEAPQRGSFLLDKLKKMAEQDEAGGQGHPERVSGMKSIKKLVEEELIPDIKKERDAKVAEIRHFNHAIKTVIKETDTFYTSLKTSGNNKTVNARASHDTCREAEAALLAVQKQKCGAMKTYLDSVVSSSQVPSQWCGKMPSASDAKGVKKYTDAMYEYFNSAKPMVDKLVNECDAATEAAKKAKRECDAKQAQFEADFCQWKTTVHEKCSNFQTRYNDSVKAFQDVVDAKEKSVEGWKAEYVGFKKILCYCNVWIENKNHSKYKAGSFNHCNTVSINTTLLDIEPPKVPKQAMCSADRAATYPGDADFKGKEYSKFLDRAAKATTTCPSPTCSSYSCRTAGWIMKRGAKDKRYPNEADCCEATCLAYSCKTSGWILKKGVEKTVDPNEKACCEIEIKPLARDLGYSDGTSFVKSLAKWGVPQGRKWVSCYDSTTNGNSSARFHARCNSASRTVWVATLSTSRTIGGYADHAWTGNRYRTSYSSFLFSLTNNHKYSLYRYHQHAMYAYQSYGPTFGGGHDFQVNLGSMTGYCNLGYSYSCRVGSYANSNCRNDFCGTYSGWKMLKIQVFKEA